MKSRYKKFILNNINKKSVQQISEELRINETKIREFLEANRIKVKRESVKEEAGNAIGKKVILISVLLIIILGLVAYSNSFKGQFVWDDVIIINDNPHIKNWSNLPNIFTHNKIEGELKKLYRPTQMLTYMADYSIWKLNVAGYHLTNLMLHILVALGIYWFINILYHDNILSTATSLLFITHPIHSEAVYYISGRADSLGLIFLLLSFISYIKNSDNMGGYVLMLSSYMLALLSRESGIILPVLLLLYHYAFKDKVRLKEFSSILAITIIYAGLRLTILKLPTSNIAASYNLLQRLPGFFAAIFEYVRLLILPFDLHMEYGPRLFNPADPKVVIGIIITASSIAYALSKKSAKGVVFFSTLWFFIALLPVSNVIYPINAYMAEHWLYLPSIGFFLILAKVLRTLYGRKEFKIFAVLIVAGLSAFYSYLTIRQGGYWKDPVSFYERTIQYAKESDRMYNNLAIIYKDIGKYDKAIPLYKKAIELNPKYAGACTNLGLAYDAIGRYEDAIASYKQAIKANPDFADAYHNLGVVYCILGKYDEAIALFKKAIELNPKYADTYCNLGLTYESMGMRQEAISSYNKAIECDSNFAAAYAGLAIVYSREGRRDLAIKYRDQAIAHGHKGNSEFLDLCK